jgi:(methylthio)acryloyl-CoA hydratase
MDAEEVVTYELRDHVAWLGLNRPQKRNAIGEALLAGLEAAIQRAQEEARALVVFGHGHCFCAGLDLAEHRARQPAEPEGQRGIYVGGGASVHVARLLGVSRMADMMLTGRVLDAAAAERAGLVNYLVEEGAAAAKAGELATQAAAMAPLTVLGVLQALPRIQDMAEEDGLFVESMMVALAQTGPEAAARLAEFVEKRGSKVAGPAKDRWLARPDDEDMR